MIDNGGDTNPIFKKIILLCVSGQFLFAAMGTSPAEAMGAVTLLIWLFSGLALRDWRDRRLWLKVQWVLPVVLMALIPFVGLLYTPDMQTGLEFAHKSRYWLYVFPTAAIIFRFGGADKCIAAFISGLCLTAIMSIVQYSGLLPLKDKAYASGMMSHIVISLFYVLGILALSHYIANAKGRRKAIYVAVSVLLLVGLAVSSGRSGVLALMLLWPLWTYKVMGGKKALVGGAVVLIIVAAVTFSPPVMDRIEQAGKDIKMYQSGEIKTSIGVRFYMWEGAMDILMEHPLKGVGTGGYMSAMKQLADGRLRWPLNHPHNSFLHMAVSYGIGGVALLCWMLFVIIRQGWRSRDTLVGFACLSYALVFIVGSLTDTLIMTLSTCFLLALFIGLLASEFSVREQV